MSAPNFLLKSIDFTFNREEAVYEMDELQTKMLNERYIREDRRFRKAFATDYTPHFIKFIQSKAQLREPYHLALMGITRSGKSCVASTIGFLHMMLYHKLFWVDPYITANNIDFLESINQLSSEETKDTIWQIDEEKNYFGVGSVSKKMKLQDVQNIIAKHNVSTVSLCPTRFANEDAHYGLRTFGRCFKTQTVRLMLYNLQEGGKGGSLPLGMLYLPIPKKILPPDIYALFDAQYQEKKDRWVERERRGEGDVLGQLKRRMAENFVRDAQYLLIKRKNEQVAYIATILGSEWTKGEVLEIHSITKLLASGINLVKTAQ